MQMAIRRIWGAAAAYNLDLGFIPDFVEILKYNVTPASNSWLKWWGKLVEGCQIVTNGGGIYGHIISGTDGSVTEATEDTGIQSYDGDENPIALIESPKPEGGLIEASVADWLAATSYSSGERTATTIGTIVRPPTHNGYLYELTTDVGAGTSEPTAGWTTTPGETSVDGGGNYWTCREENISNAGELGITIGQTLAADSQVLFVAAYNSGSARDLGDVA